MVFSSSLFIFLFLPITLLGYYILKPFRNLQNTFLLFVSLIFYAWGEPENILLMLLSIVVNWMLGILVDKYRLNSILCKSIIIITVIFNIGLLFVYKYLNFFSSIAGIDCKSFDQLPIGISFYTFQAMSYVLDIYRGTAKKQNNILNVALYVAFFPQLVAGPIVRYDSIAEQINNRKENFDGFVYGIYRFIIGLSKKVILANAFAPIADFQFSHISDLTLLSSWIGAVCYTLQIYFDFSGYSDMAIGLGAMFGFKFNENFNNPYIAKNITDFWRRWHISLSSYFRDYVYFSLGGSRVSSGLRKIFNLFVVWFLTGLWHGANYTFIIWGMYYFILLVVEKKFLLKYFSKNFFSLILAHLYTIVSFVIGWVIFRANNLEDAYAYIIKMFGINCELYDDFSLYIFDDIFTLLLIGIIFATPIVKNIFNYSFNRIHFIVFDFLKISWLILLFILSVSGIVITSYNPFIYFNF